MQLFDALQKPRRLQEFKNKWQPYCVYDWFQGTEHAAKGTGGVCAMMTMDWLRRKYFNRPGYNDPKYQSSTIWGPKDPGSFGIFSKAADRLFSEENPKRRKIMQRVTDLQAMYSRIWAEYKTKFSEFCREFEHKNGRKPTVADLESWDASVAAFHITTNKRAYEDILQLLLKEGKFKDPGEHQTEGKKLPRGFDRLELTITDSFDLEEGASQNKSVGLSQQDKILEEVYAALLSTLAQIGTAGHDAGVYVSLQFGRSAHAVGLFYEHATKDYVFFDPNFGEYKFSNPGLLCEFVGGLLDTMYSNETKNIQIYTVKDTGFEFVPL